MHIAVDYVKESMVKLLLDNNANVNVKNKYGYTPLGLAILKDDLEMAKLLLNQGADLNTPNHLGLLPLNYAIKKKKIKKIVVVLRWFACCPTIKKQQ